MSEKNNSEEKKNLSNENLSDVTGGAVIAQGLAAGGGINPGGQIASALGALNGQMPGVAMLLGSGRGNTRCDCLGKDPKCPQCGGTGYYNA